ncbi:MAG: YbjN domain-containing protein [Pseudomonadota bacterium]
MRAAALLFALVLAGCSFGGNSGPAPLVGAPPAAQGLVDARDPELISNEAWRYGKAQWLKDVMGDPLIRADWDGEPYEIWFYGCKGAKDCRDLRFVARREGGPGPSEIAEWNASHRFGKLARRDDGLMEVQMNVTLAGGVSPQNLTAVFDSWGVVLAQFRAI